MQKEPDTPWVEVDASKLKSRIKKAIDVAIRYGGVDGDHHKAWVIDQMIRYLTGCKNKKHPEGYFILSESAEYKELVKNATNDGEYEWDTGVAP